MPGTAFNVGVDRFAGLKEHVGILRGAAEGWVIGIEAAVPKIGDRRFIDKRAYIVVGGDLNGGHLMGGAEAVEEVEERHPTGQRGGVGR